MEIVFIRMNPIMKHVISFLVLISLSSGCATNGTYNPLFTSTHQIFLLNESALAQVTIGMKKDQVHKIMGDSIIIGYSSQKPLTINNPYRTEDLKVKQSTYTIEYYVSRVNQPDGVVTNDELIPLIFREGVLVAKGWDYLKSLR